MTGMLASFMAGSRLLLDNSQKYPDLLGALSLYGYDKAKIDQGTRLWNEADALISDHAKGRGDKLEATHDAEKAWEDAMPVYAKALKTARVAFGDSPRATATLHLSGSRRMTVDGWADQARAFYRNLLSEPGFLATMAGFGYPAKRLETELAAVELVSEKSHVKHDEKGEAQKATALKDAKIRELDAWISDFRAICRVAFYESPQDLERLGVFVINTHHKKKPAAAEVKK